MGIELPGMDGIEITRRMRFAERPGDRRTPVLALTVHATSDHRARCLRAGMDGFLTKPATRRRLLEAVDEALGEAPATGTTSASQDPVPEAGSDLGAALEQIGGDVGLLREMVAAFLADLVGIRRDIRQSLDARDVVFLRRILHRIEGAAEVFHYAELLGDIEQVRSRLSGNPGELPVDVLQWLDTRLDALNVSLPAAVRRLT